MDYDLAQLAKACHGRVRGNSAKEIDSVATLDTAGPGQLAYLADRKNRHFLESTKAGAVLLNEEASEQYEGDAIVVGNPQLAFAVIAQVLNSPQNTRPAIHPSAQLSPDANVSPIAWIGPNVVIEAGAEIGDHSRIGAGSFVGESVSIGVGTVLHANVTINEKCKIGNECIFQSGVVIGGDGFGYVADDNHRWIRMPQLGNVMIGDRVEIGANTTIDRGTLKDTVIHDGVKIDNLVQIAHNVIVGENTAIAACAGIAGSAVIGKRCSIGGRAGILGHLKIGDDVTIAATSLVAKSVSGPGVYSSSLRVADLKSWQKNEARIYQLDEMARRLQQLENELKKLS